jgi:hypothetical protein
MAIQKSRFSEFKKQRVSEGANGSDPPNSRHDREV